MRTKDIMWLVILIGITLFFGGTLLSYFRTSDHFGISEFLVIIALFVMWGEFLIWGNRREVQKDEMGKKIVKTSNHISYYVVYISLLILWIIDFLFLGNEENYTLFIALCIAYIANPIVQFVLVKKHID